MNDTDLIYMNQAIRLANLGLYTTRPNPRVGCLLVKEQKVIAKGWHEKAGGPHAERIALNIAGNQAKGATAYITLEPCCHYGRTPPCSLALIEAGINRAIVAMRDPNPQVQGNGIKQLIDANIKVDIGLLENQAKNLNPGFIKRMTSGLPWVRCKLAMSLDGRTAPVTKTHQYITSNEARYDMQFLRARSDAIITGIGTIIADDPALTVRINTEDLPGLKPTFNAPLQPLRIILDTQLRTPLTAKILKQPGQTWILHAINDPTLITPLKAAGAKLQQVPQYNGHLDLMAVLKFLAQLEINEVLLEAGHILAGAMLEMGLVDELIIYMAPQLMGDTAIGLMSIPKLNGGHKPLLLNIHDIRSVGKDWRITAQLK